MARFTKSPDAPVSSNPVITFDDPFVLGKAQGQIAYLRVFLGKTTARKSRPPRGPVNAKKQVKRFERAGEISYRNLSAVQFKDRVNKTDELKLTYTNLELDDHEELLAKLSKDAEMEVIIGVRGLWHIKRRMIVRDVEPEYSAQIRITFTLHDTGIKAADGEQTKVFHKKKLSQIFSSLASMAGMQSQIEINDDPIIPSLSMGRQSVAKTVVDLAMKYGLATRFTNNVLYVQEIALDDQPNARFIFGGPRGTITRLKIKGSVSGIKGATTTAKRRKKSANNSTKESKTAKKPNDSLRITYFQSGAYAKQIVTNKQLKSSRAKASQPQARTKDKGRTVNTPRTGKDAARRAKGAHIARTLKVVSGNVTVLNATMQPNSTILIEGISKVFGGKYYVGDVNYKWNNGVWEVSAPIKTTRFKTKSTGRKAKTKRGKKKAGKPVKTKPKKPRVKITYLKSGAYFSQKIGFKKGTKQ